jgi:hypothetical protein
VLCYAAAAYYHNAICSSLLTIVAVHIRSVRCLEYMRHIISAVPRSLPGILTMIECILRLISFDTGGNDFC